MRPVRSSAAPARSGRDPHRTRRRRRDGGYILATMTLLAVPLLALSGLAVDVGSWYYQANRIQRAADAAALAGVIYQPDLYQATVIAKETAAANGFVDGANGIRVDVINVDNTRITVQITDSDVPRYVSSLVDSSTVRMVRQATAEYVRPIPLGSPSSVYGNNPGVGTQPNFWASIAGPYYDFAGGDPYATKCLTKPVLDATAVLQRGNSCSTTNSDYRSQGYRFAIDVPTWAVGRTVTVQLYDAGNYDDATSDVGDFWSVNTSFQLFDSDSTPLDSTDNPPLPVGTCGTGRNSTVDPSLSGFIYIASEASAGTYKRRWYTLCTVTVNQAGVFPLQVRTSGWPAAYSLPLSGDGSNQFAIMASLSGTVPSGQADVQVYALTDMSVFTNPVVGTGTGYAEFYLSEIPVSASGKNLVLELFDPGDSNNSSGDFVMDIVAPSGAFPVSSGAVSTTVGNAGLIPRCRTGLRSGTLGTAATCTVTTKVAGQTSGIYNGQWLRIQVPLTDYTCSTSCWWRVVYRFSGGAPADRTVWLARVSGDPVRIVQ
jgi:Flp pilus assembly protein TadG